MDDRIIEKLKMLADRLMGDLVLDLVTRVAYSTDASMYQIIPDAVCFPADSGDVKKLLEFSRKYRVPIIARGAGTNMSGGVLGSGIVLDFSKYMDNILEINPGENWVRVEPGVIHGDLQRELRKFGKFFPPDPSSSDYCTVGGVVANNSSGIRAIKYGDTKDWVLDIRGILSNGKTISTEIMGIQNDRKGSDPGVVGINQKLVALLNENRETLSLYAPDVTKNSSGYNLKEALKKNAIDWNKILTGSEGTLAIFTGLKLRIEDLPKERVLFLAEFHSLDDSLSKIANIVETEPSACEILDDFLINLIVKENGRIKDYLRDDTKSILLIEYEGKSSREIEGKSSKLEDVLKGSATRVKRTDDDKDQKFLWSIRKAASPILNRVEGKERPVRMVEDIAVHPKKLAGFMLEFKELLKKHNLDTGVHGHAGSGNLHINPNVDLSKPGYREKINNFTVDAYGLVKKFGGTIAGEHGDGLLRASFVNTQTGLLADIYKKVKALFDPQGILNPGKKVTHDTVMNLKSLRYDYEYGDAFDDAFDEQTHREIAKCNGCGTCRMYCPVASTTLDERDTARSKVNILKMLASGVLPSDDKTLKEVKQVIDHCVNCKQCITECPTVVDVPKLCTIAKKMLVKRFGSDFADRYVGDFKSSVKMGASISPVSNYFLKNRTARFLMDVFLGLDRRRDFPPFKKAKYEKSTSKEKSVGSEKIIYHPGCFAEYNDPDELKSTLKILKAAGVEVDIPDMDCCYVSSITKGTYEEYIHPIEENTRLFSKYIDDGYKIVTSSASCGLALKVEYPEILGTEDSLKVRKNTFDIHEYLIFLKEKGKLKIEFNSSDKRIVFHNPCHLIAQKSEKTPDSILRLIPELTIIDIEDSCCGMAGTFGMKSKNYELSMNMGKRLFDSIQSSGADLVITSCGTCKMQIEQGTGLEVIHTVKFLADHLASYRNVMP